MKRLITMGLILSLLVIFTGTSYADRKFVTIGSGDPGGTFYIIGSGLTQLYNKKMEGVITNSQTTSGSFSNANLILQGKLNAGIGSLGGIWPVYSNRKGLGDKIPVGHEKKIRIVAPLYKTLTYILTLEDSGITKLSDLSGKKVATATKGSAGNKYVEAFLKVNGLLDKVNQVNVPFSQGIEQLGNKQVDVAFTGGGVPVAGILQLATMHDVSFVPITREEAGKLNEIIPCVYTELPAKTYKGQNMPVGMASTPTVFFSTEDTDADLIYEMTKLLWENLDFMIAIHKVANQFNINAVKDNLPIPYHEGALRYYREKGFK